MSNIKKYKVGEIYGILEGIYNDPWSRRNIVPLFMSNPGAGKTQIIEQFMKDKGAYKPPFVLSQRMPFEISGMALVERNNNWLGKLFRGIQYILKNLFKNRIDDPNFEIFISTLDKDTQDRMRYYDFDFLLELKDGDILFIDEAFNANPLTLSAFLTFLESRIMISGKQLPDIMIVAAANPQGKPVLTPQIHRRFLQYDIVFDPEAWKDYMWKKFKMSDKVSSKLCTLISSEDFSGYNYNTPADLHKATNMIIKNIPTPYDTIVKPILSTLVENTLGDIILPNGEILAQNETIEWLKLIKLLNGTITK